MLFGESVVLCPGSECFLVNAAHTNESQATQPITLEKCSSMGKIHPRREKWRERPDVVNTVYEHMFLELDMASNAKNINKNH
jgi:hypothetical protein